MGHKTKDKSQDESPVIDKIPGEGEIEEIDFEDMKDISLAELLEPDTSEVKRIKTLQEKAEEYAPYLLAFEYPIASYYLEHARKLTDKEIINILRHIKKNIDTSFSCFDDPLEITVIGSVAETLMDEPLSRHELLLTIDYILWCIDNRSWMGDKQVYVKGLCYMFGLYNELEERQYVQLIEKLGKKLGLNENAIDAMLMKNENPLELSEEENNATLLESEFFAMDDKEKTKFLLEHGYRHFDFFVTYIDELEERKEFGMIKELVGKYAGKCDDKTEIYMLAGTAFLGEDKNSAKSYYCKALHEFETDKDVPEAMKNNIKRELKKLIKECDRMK